jgi:hypothetical protein
MSEEKPVFMKIIELLDGLTPSEQEKEILLALHHCLGFDWLLSLVSKFR